MQRGELQTEDNYPHHVQFRWWMVNITTHTNLQFPATVLFSDKVSFTREGIFSTHNRHM